MDCQNCTCLNSIPVCHRIQCKYEPCGAGKVFVLNEDKCCPTCQSPMKPCQYENYLIEVATTLINKSHHMNHEINFYFLFFWSTTQIFRPNCARHANARTDASSALIIAWTRRGATRIPCRMTRSNASNDTTTNTESAMTIVIQTGLLLLSTAPNTPNRHVFMRIRCMRFRLSGRRSAAPNASAASTRWSTAMSRSVPALPIVPMWVLRPLFLGEGLFCNFH